MTKIAPIFFCYGVTQVLFISLGRNFGTKSGFFWTRVKIWVNLDLWQVFLSCVTSRVLKKTCIGILKKYHPKTSSRMRWKELLKLENLATYLINFVLVNCAKFEQIGQTWYLILYKFWGGLIVEAKKQMGVT